MERSVNTDAAVALDLADLLLGGTDAAAHAAERIGANGGWRTALEKAARWHVVPAFAERLASLDGAAVRLERELAASLRAQAAISALRSSTALTQAEFALDELSAARIPAVAIKGVAAIATLYGASSRRTVSDVDIVVRPSDLASARAVLTSRGYVDCSPPFERHVSDIAVSRTLHNFARTFVRDNFEIDLHWQFGPRPPAGLLADRIVERAVAATVENRTLRVAGPIESALLIVHHVLRGAFRTSTTIKDLVDLAAWYDVFGRAQGGELVSAACQSNLGSSLLALLLALDVRNPRRPYYDAIGALDARLDRSGRSQARRLVRFFNDALRGDAPDDATVELFAPKVYARSLLLPAFRDVARKSAGATAPSPAFSARKPVVARILRRLSRGFRIGRELAQLGRIRAYRAVASAQSRFH
jgi:hypothetical protein